MATFADEEIFTILDTPLHLRDGMILGGPGDKGDMGLFGWLPPTRLYVDVFLVIGPTEPVDPVERATSAQVQNVLLNLRVPLCPQQQLFPQMQILRDHLGNHLVRHWATHGPPVCQGERLIHY